MPTDREKIEKWSLNYHLLKFYVDFAFKCYFRVTIAGKEKINFSEPLIFAPNHQNALLDAIAVLSSQVWQPVFLARSDVFKGSFLTKTLTFLKILPVFRMRDGFSALQQNDDTFRKTMDVLNNRNGLVILPEGSHLSFKRLRQLKKGIARIAFQAEEASGFNLGLKVVPVGLDFEDYTVVGSRLLVIFGDPVPVAPFIDKYRENPAQAYNALMAKVYEGLKNVMLHIDDDEYHDEVLLIVEILAREKLRIDKTKAGEVEKFSFKQKLIEKINVVRAKSPVEYDSIIERIKHERDLLNHVIKSGSCKPHFSLALIQSLLLLITMPVFVLSFLNVLLPVGLSYKMSQKIKDPDFISSVRFVVGLISFPVFFLLQTFVVGLFFGFSWMTACYFLSLPLSALVVFFWRRTFFKLKSKWKLLLIRFTDNKRYNGLVENLRFLNEILRSI